MANSTILALVQRFCREYGLPVVTGLQGSSDGGALQMRGLAQAVGDDIWEKTDWQQCSRRATWTSVSGTNQGLLDDLFTDNFAHIVPETFWNYTNRQPIIGPIVDQNWQSLLSVTGSGPLYSYRISENSLIVDPSMDASQSLTLIYKSRNWITTAASVLTNIFATDEDVPLFSDMLMMAGIRAFWLRRKQMPHTLEMAQYEILKANEASKNIVRPTLSMDGESGQMGLSGIAVQLWRT